ncbi:MAG: hypothetical protein PHQ60_16375 [Sideroxydans sp.]|nr:hypothetical protein [Sideroxydans sp.]
MGNQPMEDLVYGYGAYIETIACRPDGWPQQTIVEGGCQDEQGGAVGVLRSADADFIAAARADVPDLLAEVERLRAVLRRIAESEAALHDSNEGYRTISVDCWQCKEFIEAARAALGLPQAWEASGE